MNIQDALDLHLKEEAFRIIGKSMRGCHQARGRAGYGSKKNFAILHETIYSWMGLFIGVAPSIVLRYRANEGRTSVCEMDAVPTGVGID